MHQRVSPLSRNSKWPRRVSKAVEYIRSTSFGFKGDSYGWSGGSLSFYHPVLRFLVEAGAIEHIGRTTEIKRSQLELEVSRRMSLRQVSRPANRIIYRIHPNRLDEISRWAISNPPLVIRKGRLTLDDQHPTPDFRWTECPGGIDNRRR